MTAEARVAARPRHRRRYAGPRPRRRVEHAVANGAPRRAPDLLDLLAVGDVRLDQKRSRTSDAPRTCPPARSWRTVDVGDRSGRPCAVGSRGRTRPRAGPPRRALIHALDDGGITSSRSTGRRQRRSRCAGHVRAPLAAWRPADDESRSGQEWIFAVTPSRPSTQGRIGEDRPVRGHTRRGSWRASPAPASGRIGFSARSTLFTMARTRTPDRSPGPCGERSSDRSTDTALRHDDRRRPQQGGHDGVRQIDDRPDSGVPRALDEQDVAVPGELRMRRADSGGQVFDHLAVDVGLGEAALDVDRAHLRERLRQPEQGLHQHRVRRFFRRSVAESGCDYDGHDPARLES